MTLRDDNTIRFGSATVSGAFDVTAASIDLTNTVTADSVGFRCVFGDGRYHETPAEILTVAGATLLTGAAGDSILLDAATNDFDSDNSGDAVTANGALVALTLRDEDNIALGGANVTGTMTITAAGTITQTGVLTGGATTTLDAGGTATGTDDITLTDATNDFGSVMIANGGNVALVDANAVLWARQPLAVSMTSRRRASV
ncbi:MAG: hypothetical protein U5O39_18975 [Gammaproteobacteria bacterium]|nr:hypothetical protein [Gammaproteobacteria bacterium]